MRLLVGRGALAVALWATPSPALWHGAAGGSRLGQRRFAATVLDRSLETSLLLQGNGVNYVIGCDEAGRGPLAGPVVVAAVACLPSSDGELLLPAADSKKLTEQQREKLYSQIVSSPLAFRYCISVISPAVIDEINILQATLRGMQEAIDGLARNLGADKSCYAIIDGNKTPSKLSVPARPMVKGDSLCYSVALASVMAKVTRDRLMKEAHQQWPMYCFDEHKGYPTKKHVLLIHKHGPCPIHRMSFAPLKGRKAATTGQQDTD